MQPNPLKSLHPVVLCGGAGTRLWPVSREAHPKPFIEFEQGQTLLGNTLMNAETTSTNEIYLVLNREHYFMAREIVEGVTRSSVRYLREPVGRNTALAIACAALDIANRHGPQALMLVMPADHVIGETEHFQQAVSRAAAAAAEGSLVLFGITPDRPETGYGYIEMEGERSNVNQVARFIEKPSAEVANELIRDGKHLWNAGIFCGQADSFLSALATHAPEVLSAAEIATTRASIYHSDAAVDFQSADFDGAPNISIDHAVFEKMRDLRVVPSNFSWGDVGSWPAVVDSVAISKDAQHVGNGRSVLVNTQNTFVRAESRIVAAVGTQNLIIIETADAVLVLNPVHAQDVKHVVSQLKGSGHDAYRLHTKVHRPWGAYTTLEEGQRFKIKRLEVKSGRSLSLQMHHHRSEHWVVVSGTAEVRIGDEEKLLRPNESCYIPSGTKHRLMNPGKVDLIMIEVQCGDYLGEDDIIRYSDNYGRV